MIMVAANGAGRGKADHPALPLTIAELAAEAKACALAGAAAIHLHVRDATAAHTFDAALYRAATAAVRAAAGPDLVIQITTEAVGRFSPSEQMACVRTVRPEAVSIALRELVPDGRAEPAAEKFFDWMAAENIAPQFILYAPDEVTRLIDLVDRGVIPFARPFLLFVLGRHTANQQSVPSDLDPFLARLEGRDLPWAMCAFGRREAACALHAAQSGGHVRVGFENNLHLPNGALAPSNAALVEATAELLHRHGFAPMDVAEARAVMSGLSG
jgi:3-keto-5-aminohexanoate cleavage enzyme